ncbi:MAG: hypothetical protein CK425_11585 [Parachlamydia sp.]|nr:MAG: hypothetical protein CK425_11585 [Parachlamydia sp.]
MNLLDYLILVLTLFLFPLVNGTILSFYGNLDKLHAESDLRRVRLEEHLKKLDYLFGSRWTIPLLLTAFSCLFWKFLNWKQIDATLTQQIFIAIISAIICWKGITLDVDLVTHKPSRSHRLLFGLSWLGVLLYPGFIILFLYIGIHFMRAWYHHQLMALRILQMFSSFLAATALVNTVQLFFGTPQTPHLATSLFLFLWVLAAHYCYSGFSKIKLGKQWYSWLWHNKIHYLAVSAYMWGWLIFQNPKQRIRWIEYIAPYDRLLQAGALLYECSWVLAGFSLGLAKTLCLVAVGFHSLIFVLTGIFFWQSILVQYTFFCVLNTLDKETISTLFNVENGLLFTLLLVILLLQKRLWQPLKLSWWDTPFIGRIHWYVVGKSGKRYGLYNDFLDPHERFFGRHTPFFLIPHKMFHGHLGEVDTLELRDALIATRGNLTEIDKLRAHYGYFVHHPTLEQWHDQYLNEFFRNFNAGLKKQVCPAWLKAPGGQFYYWGRLPPFTGQESVEQVLLFFSEEFYNEQEIIIVREQFLRALIIEKV